jgi:hypothetical protein
MKRVEGDVWRGELTLTFDELALIYKSLQAVKALGALPPEDELLDETIEIVDQALDLAIRYVDQAATLTYASR